METTYWQIQKNNSPLYPDIIRNQPENKYQTGKLLLIGGNSQSFNLVSDAYQELIKSNISEVKIILPDSLQKFLDNKINNCYFQPSTPSGGLALLGLDSIAELAKWSDGIILIGNFGQNSETTILLERLITEIKDKIITFYGDSIDHFILQSNLLLQSPNNILIIDIKQLQKIFHQLKYPKTISFSMDLMNLVNILHNFSLLYNFNLITNFNDTIIVATGGKISLTKNNFINNWQTKIAVQAEIWSIQQPKKIFETLTTATYIINH